MAGAVLNQLQKLLDERRDQPSDQTLVQRFIEGDAVAFEVLMRRHGPMVLRVCRQIVRHTQDAEDVFQGTFLVLARKAAAIRKQASVASWLHGVAYRLSAQARSGTARQRECARHDGQVPLVDRPADMTWQELQEGLHEELGHLAENHRAPLVLCYLEAKTQDEAARMLGWTVGTLRRRLERGRKLLHARLTRRGLTLPAALLAAGLSEGVTKAMVPASLVASTFKAAMDIAGGVAVSGAITPKVAALTERGLRELFPTNLKTVVALVMALGVVVGTAGFLMRDTLTATDAADSQAGAPQAQVPASKKPLVQQERPTDADGDPLPPHALARLGTLRFRTGSHVTALALSPQGKTFATVSDNWILRLWDLATGRELRRFGRVGQGRSIAFTPDGTLLVTAAGVGEGALLLWDVSTGTLSRKLKSPVESPGDWVGNVAISPDGKWVAGASQSEGIALWDISTRQLRHVFSSGDGREGATFPGPICFSPDGQTLAAGGQAGTTYLWDVATGKEKRRLVAQSGERRGVSPPVAQPPGPDVKGPVVALAFTPDGKTLATGQTQSPPCLWDVDTGQVTRSMPGSPWGTAAVVLAPDGKTLASGDVRGGVQVRETATGKELASFQAHGRPLFGLAFDMDGQRLVTSGDGSTRLWEARTGKEVVPDRGHTAGIGNCFLLPDQKTLVTTSRDGTLRHWDLVTGRELHRIAALDSSNEGLVLAPDGKTVASFQREGVLFGLRTKLRLSELSSGKELKVLGNPNVQAAQFSPDGKTLFTMSWELPERAGYIRMWDWAAGKEIRVLARQDNPFVHSFVLRPDGKALAAIFGEPRAGEFSIVVYDVATGTKLRQIPTFSTWGGCPAFSPDGKLLAVADGDSRLKSDGYFIKLVDIETGRELRRFARARNEYLRTSFSPDGKTLATAGGGNHIRLWEIATGKERLHFEGHGGSLLFADHGRLLVSASEDTTALVWDATGRGARGSEAVPSDPQTLWNALAGADAAKAYAALWDLTRAPGTTLPFLREHLRPLEPLDDKVIARLVLDLDNSNFAKRQNASAALSNLEEVAKTALRQALAGNRSLELRRRVEQLLEQLDSPTGAHLQMLRAVEVLEHIANSEAQQLLRTLSTGAAKARRTQEANAALQRLSKRAGAF